MTWWYAYPSARGASTPPPHRSPRRAATTNVVGVVRLVASPRPLAPPPMTPDTVRHEMGFFWRPLSLSLSPRPGLPRRNKKIGSACTTSRNGWKNARHKKRIRERRSLSLSLCLTDTVSRAVTRIVKHRRRCKSRSSDPSRTRDRFRREHRNISKVEMRPAVGKRCFYVLLRIVRAWNPASASRTFIRALTFLSFADDIRLHKFRTYARKSGSLRAR